MYRKFSSMKSLSRCFQISGFYCFIILSFANNSNQVYEGEAICESGEQNKTSNNGGSLGKKMRAISWTMKRRVAKKYIKALSEEKVSVLC